MTGHQKRILVACEFSGTVREAFRKRGYDAWSCDLLDTEIPTDYQFYRRLCGLPGIERLGKYTRLIVLYTSGNISITH